MTVTPATSNPTIAGTTGTPGATLSPPSSQLSQNQFLDLMMVQLKNQDPLTPNHDPTTYLSELAQFTSLEQMTHTAQSTAQAAAGQQTAAALNLLGHTVNYTDGSGQSHTGTVKKVDFTGSNPTLTVDSTSGITLDAVTEVS